jgi:uncharacterized membrane protein YphA (DoxX/SURF4 family)
MPKKKTSPVEPVQEVVPPVTETPAPALPPAPITTPAVPASDKPGYVSAIAIITLVNGIINILWGAGIAVGLLGTIVCWPIGAYPLVLGILEVIYASKLLPNPAQPTQPSTTIAIMEIIDIIFMNPFAMIGGILALVFYGDPQVRAYFARLNAQ